MILGKTKNLLHIEFDAFNGSDSREQKDGSLSKMERTVEPSIVVNLELELEAKVFN